MMTFPALLGRLALFSLCLFSLSSLVGQTPGLPRGTPEQLGVSSKALHELVVEAERQNLGLHGIMIVRKGRVLAEGWWAPYSPNEQHMLYSLSKSFTSVAIGIAQDEGLLSINDPVLKFFPEDAPSNPSENLKAMRVRDLLMMSTGQHKEDIDGARYTGAEPLVKQFLSWPVPQKPGTLFYYNTPATYMLSAILQKVSGQTALEFLRPRLFEPLGMVAPRWEQSEQGISMGGFGLNLRTEDIAKFGQLLLQRGEWQGRRLVSAAYIELATSRQASNGSHPQSDWDQGYGYQFWRCIPDFYRGDGAFGQFCIVMPQHDTVVAINSGSSDMGAIMRLLWERLLPELRPAALPASPQDEAALRTKLQNLRIPVVPNSRATGAATLAGKVYKFAPNQAGIESLTVNQVDQETQLSLMAGGKTYLLKPSTQGWTPLGLTQLPGGGLTLDNEPKPSAFTGGWTGEDAFHGRIAYYRTPYILDLKGSFKDGKARLELKVNVGFGRNEAILIEGTP